MRLGSNPQTSFLCSSLVYLTVVKPQHAIAFRMCTGMGREEGIGTQNHFT